MLRDRNSRLLRVWNCKAVFTWRCNFYRVKQVAAKGLLSPYRGELYPEKRVLKERTCGSTTGKLKTGLTVRQGLCGGAT